MKRLKFTRTGKVLRRAGGQNHFRAKQSRSSQLNKKRVSPFISIGKEFTSRYMAF